MIRVAFRKLGVHSAFLTHVKFSSHLVLPKLRQWINRAAKSVFFVRMLARKTEMIKVKRTQRNSLITSTCRAINAGQVTHTVKS